MDTITLLNLIIFLVVGVAPMCLRCPAMLNIVSQVDSLHEMSNPYFKSYFLRKIRKLLLICPLLNLPREKNW